MYDALVEFTQNLPAWTQWIAVMLLAAIPFVESHFGALIGILAGVPAPIAVIAAIIGNALSVAGFAYAASAARHRVLARRGTASATPEPSRRRQRLKVLFDRFGVAGVGLLGQMIVPNQITTGMMVSFGARRSHVLIWQFAGIILWAVVFALLAQAGVSLLR